jgi:hypothetical protein
MADPESPKTPNERLAALIAEALRKERLVPANRIEDVRRKLASGSARDSDWRVWVESALRPEDGEGSANASD